MLISLAVDYHHADLATRERFRLTPARLDRLYALAQGETEIVAIATCNRSKAYAWIGGQQGLTEATWRLFARSWMIRAVPGASKLLAVAVRRTGVEAARHLFRVASGIDQQVLGDGGLARSVARRVRADQAARRPALDGPAPRRAGAPRRTAGAQGDAAREQSAWIGAEAARLAAQRFGSSIGRARAVVVGCGKTGERVARQLVKLGVTDIVLAERKPDRAQRLATLLRGRAAPIDALYAELAMADVAVFATTSRRRCSMPIRSSRCGGGLRDRALPAAPHRHLAAAQHRRVGRRTSRNVVVADLDALLWALVAGERDRRDAVPLAEAIVEEELQQIKAWLTAAPVRTTLGPLHRELRDICRREVAYITAHGHGLADESEDAIAERTADRIVAKLLARPMIELRGAMLRGEPVEDLVSTLTRLFPPGALDGARLAPLTTVAARD